MEKYNRIYILDNEVEEIILNQRERILRAVEYDKIDRLPDYEFGVWPQTIERWIKEGLETKTKNIWDVIPECFNTDDINKFHSINVNIGLYPEFKQETLEETDQYKIVINKQGSVCKVFKDDSNGSMPQFIKYAIETRKDWERLKEEKLKINDNGRFDANIEEECKKSFTSETPTVLFCGSLYGTIRNLMGVENLSYAVNDDPMWVEDMIEHFKNLTIENISKIQYPAKIDFGFWWEDMCYKSGPLISPEFVRDKMLPKYKEITAVMKDKFMCNHHILDCDGNIGKLLPIWLEAGIDIMFPMEAECNDVLKLRETNGDRSIFKGYFNKKALIDGKYAIDKEFERLRPLAKQGGFIPHVDHLVPPDVSLENYRYYRDRKIEFINLI